MNLPKKIFFTFVFYFSTFFSLFCNDFSIITNNDLSDFHRNFPTGTELCDSINSNLNKNGINTKKQTLVFNGINYFPYNIIIEQTESKQNKQTNEKLLLYFTQEDAYSNTNDIIDIINYLNAQDISYTVLLSYGDNFPIKSENTICGIQTFLSSINTNKTYNTFIFNFSAQKNGIITGSKGSTSPSWMIKTAFSTFAELKITEDIPTYFISQLSKYNFLNDDLLNFFFNKGIPSIKLNLNNCKDISSFVIQIIDEYKSFSSTSNDYHSLMFRIFKKTFWLTEYTIIKIIIFTIFLSLIFIFTLGLLNHSLKNEAWNQIKRNWYTLPLIYLLTVGGFFLGKLIHIFIYNNFHGNNRVYDIFIIQIIISSFLVSFFYLFELFYNKNYGERSVDFLMLISTFANQYLFCIADISLFPFFLIQCVLAILTIITKRNITHIILLTIIIILYIPYIFILYNIADFNSLHQFFITSNLINFLFPFILLPIYLMLLRIFTATKKRFIKKRVFLIIVSSTYIFFFLVMIFSNIIFFPTKQNDKNNITILNSTEDFITISNKDKKVFSDIIRTINIDCKYKPLLLNVTIENENSTPVLYSDYDYETNHTKSFFLIPSNPSSNLSFTYGTQNKQSKISVELIYFSENNYYCCTKDFFIE